MLLSTVWGPSLWYFIHTLSYNYDEKLKEQYKNFFNYLKIIIPCPVCREHYNHYIIQNPIKLNNKNEFILWCYTFHNKVNKRLDKSIISIDDCNKLYKKIDNTIILEFIQTFMKEYIKKLIILKKLMILIVDIYPDVNIRNNYNSDNFKNNKGIFLLLEITNFIKLLKNH